MGSIVHTLRIRSLRKLVEASRLHSDALARRFENAKTDQEKSRIAHEYDNALKRTHGLQLKLEREERKEREAAIAEQADANRKTGT